MPVVKVILWIYSGRLMEETPFSLKPQSGRTVQGNGLQGGSTSLLQWRSGRLLLPFHGGAGHQASQHNVVYCCYNDDDGQTWSRSNQPLDLPMRGPMEDSVAELPDGELAMSLRTQSGTVFLSRSMDGREAWQYAPANPGVFDLFTSGS